MNLKLMPQELEVWYLIPAIRKELSKFFIDNYNFSQKEVAGILGITESAVSQYFKSKRANELKFDNKEKNIIKKYADKIVNDKKNIRKYLFELSNKLRGTKSLCDLHHKQDSSLPHNCRICMGE